MQQNPNQKEQKDSTFTTIKKSLGLVSDDTQSAEQPQAVTSEAAEMAEAVQKSNDPINLLKGQHREVEALFAEIEGTGEKAHKTKERLFATLAEKLTMHTDLEEKIFYQAARKVDEHLVLESYEEHAAMKNMLKRLASTKGSDETFDAKITVLKELIEHHVKEEENDLFPKCRSTFGNEEMERIGHAMVARMEKSLEAAKAMRRNQRTTSARTTMKPRAKTSASKTKARAKTQSKKTSARKSTSRTKKRAA